MPVIKFVKWIAEKVLEQAEKEYYDPEVIRSELVNLSEKLEAGEITDDEYKEREGELLERLAQGESEEE